MYILNLRLLFIILIFFLSSCSSDDYFSSPESSWIKGASYDSQTEVLIIETNTQDYTFIDVPKDVWTGFKGSESKGRYYNQKIRGRYQL